MERSNSINPVCIDSSCGMCVPNEENNKILISSIVVFKANAWHILLTHYWFKGGNIWLTISVKQKNTHCQLANILSSLSMFFIG